MFGGWWGNKSYLKFAQELSQAPKGSRLFKQLIQLGYYWRTMEADIAPLLEDAKHASLK